MKKFFVIIFLINWIVNYLINKKKCTWNKCNGIEKRLGNMYSLISCVDVREIDLLRVYRKYVEVYRCKCVVDISIHVHNARVVNRTNGNLGQPSNIPRGGRAFAQYIQATSELSSIFPFISFPLIFEKRIDLDYRFFR